MEHTFYYGSEIQKIPAIREDLTQLGQLWHIPESELRQISVIIEELFSNIVRFGYHDRKDHRVEIRLKRTHDELCIEITDDGVPFNPIDYKLGVANDPAAMDTGGMGITLVKTFSDSITYERSENKNCLIIHKMIKSQP